MDAPEKSKSLNLKRKWKLKLKLLSYVSVLISRNRLIGLLCCRNLGILSDLLHVHNYHKIDYLFITIFPHPGISFNSSTLDTFTYIMYETTKEITNSYKCSPITHWCYLLRHLFDLFAAKMLHHYHSYIVWKKKYYPKFFIFSCCVCGYNKRRFL